MVDYRAEAAKIAQKYGIDPNLFVRLIEQESGFNPEAKGPATKSGEYALGLTQLMPGTALDMGVMRLDPLQNLEGGAKYFRQQLDTFGGDPALALAAYNAGPGNVKKYGGIPPFQETQNYVSRILGTPLMDAQAKDTQQGVPAVAENTQPQQKGILSFITDPEKRAKLGLVLSSLSTTPNAGVQQMLTNKIAGFEDTRTKNKTVEWLTSRNRSDLAEAVSGGMLSPKDAVAEVVNASTATDDPAAFRSLDMTARAGGLVPQSEGGDGRYEEFMLTAGAGLRAGAAAEAKLGATNAANAPAANAIYNALEFQVNDLLSDPYLPAMLGPVQSRLPNMSADAARVQAKMDQISGGAFLQARQMLKGGGQITNYESDRAEKAFVRMSAAQNENDFRQAMQDFLDAVKLGLPKLEGAAPADGAAPQSGIIAPSGITTLTYNPTTGKFE
jgi:hypothetical protein